MREMFELYEMVFADSFPAKRMETNVDCMFTKAGSKSVTPKIASAQQ
jgi:hypothetical protein